MGDCALCLPALTGAEYAASFPQPGTLHQLMESSGSFIKEDTIESHKVRRCSEKSLDHCQQSVECRRACS